MPLRTNDAPPQCLQTSSDIALSPLIGNKRGCRRYLLKVKCLLDRAGDDAGAATEAGEPVPLTGIVALDELRPVLADVVPAFRRGGVVGRPIVGAEQAHAPGFQPAQQALQRSLVAT